MTTWNHNFFEKFDADKIIDSMMASDKWPKNKYFGKTKDQIKLLWNQNRDQAAEMGTCLHYMIEMFMNMIPNHHTDHQHSLEQNETTLGDILDFYQSNTNFIHPLLLHPTLSEKYSGKDGIFLEWFYFLTFANAHRDLIPYRTEWTIYDEEIKLSGSIDMVFKDQKGAYHIFDWKRSKEIIKTNGWNKFAIHPSIDHIPDTNYWHYCLQLNTYKAILQRKYNITINDLYLVCLHPENKNNSYMKIKVANLQDEVSDLFSHHILK